LNYFQGIYFSSVFKVPPITLEGTLVIRTITGL
jgi:hypothetical protein